MLSKTKKSKIFVLDTNVILHDHTCIYQFQDNDIILPITVLEELDKFKRGNDLINFQAREFTRLLDEIVGDELFNGGKPLGIGKGKLRIETGKPFSDQLKVSFREDIPDHRILSIAEHTVKSYPKRRVILISKDINLRMKAKSLGIQAEDYKTDQVTDENHQQSRRRDIAQGPDPPRSQPDLRLGVQVVAKLANRIEEAHHDALYETRDDQPKIANPLVDDVEPVETAARDEDQ